MGMESNTLLLVGAAARKKILKGINAVAIPVCLSMGPEGKNALLPRSYNRGPRITNDGYTISENIRPRDEHERLAAENFKEASKKTNELVGDGTSTTACVGAFLINKVFNELAHEETPSASLVGQKSSHKGVRAIRKEMKDAKELVIAEIKKMATPIKTLEDLEKIAIVSIGKEDESVAKQVAKAVWDVARDEAGNFIDNHIDIVEGYKGEIEVEIVKGMRFPAKVAHRAFVNKIERFEMVAEDTAVFITNYNLDNPFQVVDILNKLKVPKIAFFAPEFSAMVIKSLIETTKNGLFCYPVKCPALRTEQLIDLAVYTGARVIDKETGGSLTNVTTADLGFAEKIVVKDTENREDAVLLGGKGEKKAGVTLNDYIDPTAVNSIADRIETLRGQLKLSQNDLTKIQLEKRIANLSSAVGVIRVGASTSKEGLFLKLKVEDGVYSCKAALQEGYVRGGGLCLKEIAETLPQNILTEALKEPYAQIQRNAGGNLEIGDDIIDSAKVVRLVIEHGVSIAATTITCDISIPEEADRSPADGYSDIAKAIKQYAYYWAKKEGLIRASEDSAEEDRNLAFERVLMGDKD